MSKTKGTGVDPLELTQKFGTDALRYMLASMAAPGTDIIFSEDRILGARAFANKIWNAARFLFLNLEKAEASAGITLEELAAPEIRAKAPYAIPGEDGLIHRWIFSRLAAVSEQASRALQDFRFHEASQAIYQFFWGDFCDWYIEWVKPQLAATDRAVAVAAWRNIFAALEAALRLLHPIMPFLTEELWYRLPQPAGARSIALDKFPEPRANWIDAQAEKEIATLQEIITAARNIRAEMKIDQKRKIPADFSSSDSAIRKLAEQNAEPLARLATLSALNISSNRLDSAGPPSVPHRNSTCASLTATPWTKTSRLRACEKKSTAWQKTSPSKQSRLADETFVSKAPAKIVEDLRATLASRQIEHQKLLDRLKQLE